MSDRTVSVACRVSFYSIRWGKLVAFFLALFLTMWLLITPSVRADCQFINTGNERFGVAANGNIIEYDYPRLGIGWFHNWGPCYPIGMPAGLTFYATAGAHGKTVAEESSLIEQYLSLYPERYPDGMVWLIGNEVGLPWDDNLTPTEYAQRYHDYYVYLKGLNPTFQIGTGAILPWEYDDGVYRGYPGNMTGIEWLSEVKSRYQALYGQEMPIDVYNIHVYVRPSHPTYFAEQIHHFRQAMANLWNARDKPLIITEMGNLESYDIPATQSLMVQAFDFLTTATSDQYGCTTDGNRLVQRWAWIGLTGWSPDGDAHAWDRTALFDYYSKAITPLGETYADYTSTYYNYRPETTSVTPDHGSIVAGFSQIFTSTHCDANGWNHLHQIKFLINDTLNKSGAFFAFYDRVSDKLYLRNDNDTAWLGGYKPSTPHVIENSFARLRVDQCQVWRDGATLTIRWFVEFKPAFGTKACNLYFRIRDLGGKLDGWRSLGTFNVYATNDPPQHGSISPNNGSSPPGELVTFTMTCSDPNGHQDIQNAQLLINDRLTHLNGFRAYYDYNYNTVKLLNDEGTAWFGPYVVGTPHILENSQASLDVQNMTVQGDGNTVTITWPIRFKQSFTGEKKLYQLVKDDSHAKADWAQIGTWTVVNHPPSIGSISPGAGNSGPGQWVTITSTFADPDGWTNLRQAQLLVRDSLAMANSLLVRYDQDQNKLYLLDDAGSSWLGGYAPGSSHILENSQGKLDVGNTVVSGSGTTLTISWRVAFKSSLAGTQKTYHYVQDDGGEEDGWTQVGTWTIANQPPSTGTVTPNNGNSNPGETISLTTTCSDPDGWQQIQLVQFLINDALHGDHAFYAYYDQNANRIFLRNDTNTAWFGGYAPGSAHTLENSQAILDLQNTTISGDGDTLSITWCVTFKEGFTGLRKMYQLVKDDSNVKTEWVQIGSWTFANQPPSIGGVTPSNGSSDPDEPVTITSVCSDPDGWENIKVVQLLINTQLQAPNAFYVFYNQNVNKIWLLNDAGNAWIGGYPPGSSHILENSQGILDLANTSVTGSGNQISVHWAVRFKTGFAGPKNMYQLVKDDANVKVGWSQVGTWTVTNTPPSVGTAAPNSGSCNPGEVTTFTSVVSDANGWQHIKVVQFLINDALLGSNAFYAFYQQNKNKIYLMNDSGTAWLGGVAPGSAYVLENSQVILDVANTTVSGFGNDLSITWVVTFKNAFVGSKKIYQLVKDDANAKAGWTQVGTWTINGSLLLSDRALWPDVPPLDPPEEIQETLVFPPPPVE